MTTAFYYIWNFAAIAAWITIIGCGKSKDKIQPAAPTGTFGLQIYSQIGAQAISQYGNVHQLSDGRRISVSTAQLYLSDFKVISSTGQVITVPDSTLLIKPSVTNYQAATIAAGQYSAVHFKVGFNLANNDRIPDSKLRGVLLDETMWASYHTSHMGGYKYLNFQGQVDTSHTPGSAPAAMHTFKYYLGLDTEWQEIQLNKGFTVEPGKTVSVNLVVDFGKLLQGIQFNNLKNLSVTTVQDQSLPTALQLKQNVGQMFQIQP